MNLISSIIIITFPTITKTIIIFIITKISTDTFSSSPSFSMTVKIHFSGHEIIDILLIYGFLICNTQYYKNV